MKYVDLTPTWVEILPTWLMIFEQAARGDCTNPDLIKDNARAEFRRMVEAADNFNALVQGMKDAGWESYEIKKLIADGKLSIKERSEVEHDHA
jgi:hypothetical protein